MRPTPKKTKAGVIAKMMAKVKKFSGTDPDYQWGHFLNRFTITVANQGLDNVLFMTHFKEWVLHASMNPMTIQRQGKVRSP